MFEGNIRMVPGGGRWHVFEGWRSPYSMSSLREKEIMGVRSAVHGLVIISAATFVAGCSGSPSGDGPTAPTAPTGPTVLLSVVPAVGTVDVGLTADIEVRFSQSIPTTMRNYIALHDGDCPGPVVGGMWSRTSDQVGLHFMSFEPLMPETEYTIHVGGGMTDGSGMTFDLGTHGFGMGGEWATEEMVLGPDGMGMGMDMMGQTISHTGLGWAYSDGTYGMVFQFTTGG